MSECRLGIWLLLSVLLLTILSSAVAFDFNAPSGVKLPLEMNAVGGAGWKVSGDSWSLPATTEGVLEVPAWWTGNRPPRGEMVVLEFDFKDSFDSPARASVFSGMSVSSDFSELHRFGGKGDDAWKTARIPCPSDLTFLNLSNNSLQFQLISASGLLEIKSPRLTVPKDTDEENYNAQTREWILREQHKRVRIDSIYYSKRQTPVLEEAWDNEPLVPFHRNYMMVIEPVSAPQAGEAVFPASVKISLSEYEPVQLGVYANGRDLENVTITVDPVKGKNGNVIVKTTVRAAEFSLVKNWVHGYFIDYFPQRLWPAYAFNVKQGDSHLVLLDLQSKANTDEAGKYRTTVRFKAWDLDEVAVPLVIEILPYSLLSMENAGLKLGGCTTGLIPEYEMEILNEYNHNMINIWHVSVRPLLYKKGDSFEMDFRIMDDWMAAAKRSGFTDMVYFLGGNPPLFPRTMHWPRLMADCLYDIKGESWKELSFEDPYKVPPQLVPHLVEWARRFGQHVEAKDWPNIILTPFDEPAKWVQYYSNSGSLPYIKNQFIQQVDLIRQGWPDVQIYGSIHHYYGGIDFLPHVDIFCTNAIEENWNLGEEVREAGKIFWQYSGTNDKGLPGVARYTFGYYFADHNSRGSLVWAYNWGQRFDTIDGSNWMYAWQTPFDLIPTPYMIGLREAWDDRRLRETLIKSAKEKKVDLTNFLGRLSIDIANARGRGGASTLDDFWETAKSDLIMDQWKQLMINKLLMIQNTK